MSFDLDNDTGTIFKNDKKEADNHPDYKGKIKLNGKERGIALWIRESKKGNKYMFAKVSDFQVPDEVKEAVKESPQNSFDDSDVPFMRLPSEVEL